MQGFERVRIASALLSGAVLATFSASPIRSQVRGRTTGGGAVVIVHLEEMSGSPFQQPATVTPQFHRRSRRIRRGYPGWHREVSRRLQP